MLNYNLKQFQSLHKKKKNIVFFYSKKSKGVNEINNLINNILNQKNSFIFESVEKGIIKGRYTIFGSDPDKIWEFNKNKSFIINKKGKKKLKKGNPKEIIENIINNFKFEIPKTLPPISSLLSGYFSYDIIRYIENIPDTCKNDLKIPDARILRPKTLIIHDNLKKKIFYIINCFADEKISNYKSEYFNIKNKIRSLIIKSKYNFNFSKKNYFNEKINIKSNISKKKYINIVKKAKKYIKKGDIFQLVL